MSDTTISHPDIILDDQGDDIDRLLEQIQHHLDDQDGPTAEELEEISKADSVDTFRQALFGEPVSWRTKAACRGMSPSLFYLERGDNQGQREAKKVCAGCPVREDCLQEAVDNGEIYGVWGGATYNTFKKLRRQSTVAEAA